MPTKLPCQIQCSTNTIPAHLFTQSKQELKKQGFKIKEIPQKIKSAGVAALDFAAPKNPVTLRREIRLVPAWVEKSMGVAYYDSVCPKYKVSKNVQLNQRVEKIFKELVKHCERKDLAYEVRVMEDSKTVNAFCLPGGKVVITTALLDKLEKEKVANETGFEKITLDDKIAAVLSHEIVHAAAGHTARKLQLKMLISGVAQVAGYVLSYVLFPSTSASRDPRVKVDLEKRRKNFRKAFNLTSGIAGFITSMHNSRAHELESDKHGIKYMHLAKYNMDGAIWLQKMFSQMKKEKELDKRSALDKGFELIATHPCSEKRVEANRETIKIIRAKGLEAAFN